MKGSYIVVIELTTDKKINVGKLGKICFKPGLYFYVGSALNGLEQRINRHIRNEKKVHWHIDYLLEYGKIIEVYYKEGTSKDECKISRNLAEVFQSIQEFGCSDCKCSSHLYYGSKNDFIKNINKMNFKKYSISQ